MALFDEYFSINYQRGPSFFDNFVGTMLGTQLKENKEMRKLELAALDPSSRREQISDLEKRRSDLFRDLNRLSRPSSGGSYTTQTTRPGDKDAAELEIKLLERNEERAGDFRRGKEAVNAREFEAALKNIEFSTDANNAVSDLGGITEKALSRLKSPSKTRHGKAGIGTQIIETLEANPKVPEEYVAAIKQNLTETGYLPQLESDLDVYEDPETLTDKQKQLIDTVKAGTVQTAQRFGGRSSGLDPSQSAGILMQQIQATNARIKQLEGLYDQEKQEYLDLIRNPGRNLALSPIATRPSRLGRALDIYGQYRTTRPEAAEAMMEASREAKELTVPSRFAGLAGTEDAAGTAPIDVILNRASNLETLRGTSRQFDISDSDVALVKSSLEQMKEAIESPIFGKQKYGDVQIGENESLSLDRFINEALAAVNYAETQSPSIQKETAQMMADAIVDWSKTQDDQTIKLAQKDHRPTDAINRSISNVQFAIDKAKRTGDTASATKVILDEENKVNQTSREITGGVGNAFLESVEKFKASNNINQLSSDLFDAQSEINTINNPTPEFDDELFDAPPSEDARS